MILSINFGSRALKVGFKQSDQEAVPDHTPYGSPNLEEIDPYKGLLNLFEDCIEPANRECIEISPFLATIRNRFDSMREKGDKVFLAFGNEWMELHNCLSLPHNQNAQYFVENYLEKNPTQAVLMALDLEQTFQMQFPQHLYGSISRWDAVYMQPIINEQIMPYRTIAGRPHPHQKPI